MTTATHRPIRFYHRGDIVQVDGVLPTRTVLDWLREDAGCTGTKEGCNEGDCGACTVVVAELSPAGTAPESAGEASTLLLRPANACIRFLPTLDGKALFTVEDLKAIAGGRLHPVQQALVDCHGSQCGFCTPGFAMSLFRVYEDRFPAPVAAADKRVPDHGANREARGTPDRRELADALSGNLCRCTGYRPILEAGERMFALPAARLDREPVVAALERLRDEAAAQGSFHYRVTDPATGRAHGFHSPATPDELAALRLGQPDARLLAGSTDIGLWVNKQHRDVGDLIHLGNVAALATVEERGGELAIGAAASLEDAWSALAARFDGLEEVWLRFASPPIRHAGTMGGNVANGSPIGDAPPVLMALDARLELRRGDATRQLPLDAFYLDYMKNRLEPGEFLQRILVPLPSPATDGRQRHLRAYKISKRFDSDISAVFAAMRIVLEGDTVAEVRLAFGGMAATVRRAARAEAAMLGEPWSKATVAAAQAALARDFEPITDLRASSGYRMQVAGNLLLRFFLETHPSAPLAAGAASVWRMAPGPPDATASPRQPRAPVGQPGGDAR